jgi:hypothetical protein
MTNMTYLHTIFISHVNTMAPLVLVMCAELIQLPCDVIYGASVKVPVCVNTIKRYGHACHHDHLLLSESS